jgi:beta-glucosidase
MPRLGLPDYDLWSETLHGIKKQFPEAEIMFEPGTNLLRPTAMVPATALTASDSAPGLTGEVFANDTYSGPPVEKRIDAAGKDSAWGRTTFRMIEEEGYTAASPFFPIDIGM